MRRCPTRPSCWIPTRTSSTRTRTPRTRACAPRRRCTTTRSVLLGTVAPRRCGQRVQGLGTLLVGRRREPRPVGHRTAGPTHVVVPRDGPAASWAHRADSCRGGFTPWRVAELEPRIETLTRSYLDNVSDEFDFVTDFAGNCRWTSCPSCSVCPRPTGPSCADSPISSCTANRACTMCPRLAWMRRCGSPATRGDGDRPSPQPRRRSRRPHDRAPRRRARCRRPADRLTDDEIIAFLFLMVVAGNETTTKLLAHVWYWGWRCPDERAEAVRRSGAHRRLGGRDAALRHVEPIIARTACVPVELHGGTIPAGGRTVLLIGAANRDERVFSEPDRFDLDRPAGGAQRACELRLRAALLSRCRAGPSGVGGGAPRARGAVSPTTTSTSRARRGCTR